MQNDNFMDYSTQTQKTAKYYGITERDVLFLQLIAAGADRGEAYHVIYSHGGRNNNTIEQARTQTNDWIAQHPAASLLLSKFKNRKPRNNAGDINEAREALREDEEMTEEERKKISDKSYIIKKLWLAAGRTSGKEQAQIYMSIADLQRMKQEESKIQEEKRRYFLPFRSKCRACELMKIYKNTMENQETDEKGNFIGIK